MVIITIGQLFSILLLPLDVRLADPSVVLVLCWLSKPGYADQEHLNGSDFNQVCSEHV